MDAPHIWTILDRIRETQLQHGAALATMQKQIDLFMKRQEELAAMVSAGFAKTKDSSVLPRWLSFSQPIVKSAAQWATGLLTMAFVLKGGDLMSALKILVALL